VLSKCLSTVAGLASAIALLFHAGCDHGLSPEMGITGFEGRIRVLSSWPPADSLLALRVAATRDYPPRDVLTEYLQGTLVFSDELPRGQSAFDYRVRQENIAGVFKYFIVVQQFGSNPFEDWRVVGVYAPSGDSSKPGEVDFKDGRWVSGIDITVDFYNLPPQPF